MTKLTNRLTKNEENAKKLIKATLLKGIASAMASPREAGEINCIMNAIHQEILNQRNARLFTLAQFMEEHCKGVGIYDPCSNRIQHAVKLTEEFIARRKQL